MKSKKSISTFLLFIFSFMTIFQNINISVKANVNDVLVINDTKK